MYCSVKTTFYYLYTFVWVFVVQINVNGYVLIKISNNVRAQIQGLLQFEWG